MTCLRENNQGADLLIGYLEETLPSAERQALDAHASDCAECRGLLAVQASLDLPVPEVSSNFDAGLYARIAADQARRPWWNAWTPLVAVAAVLAVAVYVQRPAPVSVDADVQQLEQALEDLELLSAPESL